MNIPTIKIGAEDPLNEFILEISADDNNNIKCPKCKYHRHVVKIFVVKKKIEEISNGYYICLMCGNEIPTW